MAVVGGFSLLIFGLVSKAKLVSKGFQMTSSGLLWMFLVDGDGGALLIGTIVSKQQVNDGEGGEVLHSLVKYSSSLGSKLEKNRVLQSEKCPTAYTLSLGVNVEREEVESLAKKTLVDRAKGRKFSIGALYEWLQAEIPPR